MKAAVHSVREWGEMVKFSHSVFALPFALLATFLAARPTSPSGLQIALIVVCMVAARSAAMTFNRIVDARFDAKNPRTLGRSIPAGRISHAAAWAFFVVAALLFTAATAGFWQFLKNPWPLLLAVPTLWVLCGYSYAKRFTRFSHLILGAVIAFAPVAAWIAIRPETLGIGAGLLMLAAATWIGGFDIIYACLDVEFDRKEGLHSLPARIGIAPSLWIARGLHGVTVASLLYLGRVESLGWIYYSAVGVTTLLLVVENAIVRPDDLRRVNLAFFTVNGCVGLVLGILGVCDILMN